ncbi:hypothetical protein D0Z00_002619 [Geotrichum galactomycetum]|uniref:Uncharacterized protein n=1 Tax=Geotrichum galactomycetum TaxID=27317 RepID=A0ACB6V3S0_9ASCO|nr:hypothetical protein D0Z00_002619 [Geotrichum candidum]
MKKFFAKKHFKELTPEERQNELESAGIPTKTPSSRTSKFSQYSDYANQLNASRGQTIPSPNQNPYAAAASPAPPGGGYQSQQSPYGGYQQQQPSGGHNYGRGSPAPSYHTTAPQPSANASPYASAQNDYNQRYNGSRLAPQPSIDTLQANKNQLFGDVARQQQEQQQQQQQSRYEAAPNRAALFGAAVGGGAVASKQSVSEEDELNMTASELEKIQGPSTSRYTADRYSSNRYGGSDGGEQYDASAGREEMDSEDEDVEAIRQQVRFLKKDTVNETRNALQAAARAEESGRNALGILGAQGERIANTERSLALAETQNNIAEEKARELKTLNRSMFAVHVKNPFTAKRNLEMKEEAIKNEKRMEQIRREEQRAISYKSQQRVTEGLLTHTSTAQKYASQRRGVDRSKYMVGDGDSEDEEMESEIERNLDSLSHAASRLNKLALTANAEIVEQNKRLDHIAEKTDKLDLNVHLNTTRLSNIH